MEFRLPLNFVSHTTDVAADGGILATVSDTLIGRVSAAMMENNGIYLLQAELQRPTTDADEELIRQALQQIDEKPWKVTRGKSNFISYMTHEITVDYDKILAEHVSAIQNDVT